MLHTASQQPFLSIIIPTLNEAEALAQLLNHIEACIGPASYEVLICDGGSTDNTLQLAERRHTSVICAGQGRAVQMNAGARAARGEVLYFLHADTFPPQGFAEIIRRTYSQGYLAGCFRLAFDLEHWILRFSGWASRINLPNWQFGDQSLYVQRALFLSLGGFNEQLLLMEDVDAAARLRKKARFTVMPYHVITSARKYRTHGVFRTEFTHLVVYTMYLLHIRQYAIARVYKRMLRRRRKRQIS